MVQAGRLRVLVEDIHGPRIVRELGPGDVLGELALLTGSARSASVQAVRDSALLSLEAGRFDALLADDPPSRGRSSASLPGSSRRRAVSPRRPPARASSRSSRCRRTSTPIGWQRPFGAS